MHSLFPPVISIPVSRIVFTLHQTDKFYQQLTEPPDVGGFYATQLNSRIITVNTPSMITISNPEVLVAFQMVSLDFLLL